MVSNSKDQTQVTTNSIHPLKNGTSNYETNFEEDLPSVLEGLCSKSHLNRDRTLHRFETSLPQWSQDAKETMKIKLVNLLSLEESWESIYGALEASRIIIESKSTPEEFASDDRFSETVLKSCKILIKHSEARVRQAVSKLIGSISTRKGKIIWDQMSPILLSSVASNFDLDESQRLQEASRVAAHDLDEVAADKKKNGLRMVHETEGWRGLETTLLATGELMDGCGAQVLTNVYSNGQYEDIDGVRELIGFIQRAKDHPNRFVREAGLRVLNSVANAAAQSCIMNGGTPVKGEDGSLEYENPLITRMTIACESVLAEGLQDNWSQVRFAASVAVRTILKNIPRVDRRKFYPLFLPRMCLNRHYVAEGVRNYSQETWRTIIGFDGKPHLLLNLSKCMEFYETQCGADNHAVREAACQTLAEATIRLERTQMSQYAALISKMLLNCFRDESWPVRDHACRALSEVIATFPKIVDDSGFLPEAAKLFQDHLSDNIASVRKNCAISVVQASLAFPDGHKVLGLQKIANFARSLVGAIYEQEENKTPKKVRNTQFGASTVIPHDHGPHDRILPKDGTNPEDEPTNRMLYSCGSLAPKLRRGSGCMDHGFSREREGWEKAEGGLLVWQNLMNNERGREIVQPWFEDIVQAGLHGAEKSFPGRTKWITVVIESIRIGFEIAGSRILPNAAPETTAEPSAEDQLVKQVVKLLIIGKNEEGAANTASAITARITRSVFGLRRYCQAERDVKIELEK